MVARSWVWGDMSGEEAAGEDTGESCGDLVEFL